MTTTHNPVSLKSNNHIDSMNGKPLHVHIPRIYNGMDKTFNSPKIPGGGMVECGVCGEILMDNAN